MPSGPKEPKVYIDQKTGKEVVKDLLSIIEEDGSRDLLFPAKGNVLIEINESEITDANRAQVYKTPEGRWFIEIAESEVEIVEKSERTPRPGPNPDEVENEKNLKTLEKGFEAMAPGMTTAEYTELAQFFSLEENYEEATEFAEKVEPFIAKIEAATTDEEKLTLHQDFRKEVMIPMINLMRGIEVEEGDEEGGNEQDVAAIKEALEQIVPDMTPEQYEELFKYLRSEENHDEATELAAQLVAPMKELSEAVAVKDEDKEKKIRAEIREKILLPFINKIVEIDSPEKKRQEETDRRKLEQMISALEIQKQEMIKRHDQIYAQSVGKQINPREFHVLTLEGERVMAKMGMDIARVHIEQARYKKEYREKYGEDWPKPPEFVQHLLEKSQNLPKGTFDPGKPGMMALLLSMPRKKQLEMLEKLKKEYEKKKEINKRKKNLDKNKPEGSGNPEEERKEAVRQNARADFMNTVKALMDNKTGFFERGPLNRKKDKNQSSLLDARKKLDAAYGGKTPSALVVEAFMVAAISSLDAENQPDMRVVKGVAFDIAKDMGNIKGLKAILRDMPNLLKKYEQYQTTTTKMGPALKHIQKKVKKLKEQV